MIRLRTKVVMAMVGASLAFAPVGAALAKGKDTPPGAAKAPKEDKDKKAKKDKEHAQADNPGLGHDKSDKGHDKPDKEHGKPEKEHDTPDKGSGAADETPSAKDVPPGLEGKPPGHPSGHGHGAARRARTDELEAKQSKGSLTEEEKGELAELQKKRERFEGLKGKHEKRKADREKRRLESKRDALRRFPGFEKNASARDEFKKHAQRLAKLERAKDVAEAEERPEVVARIDKVIAKEKERHEKWLTKHATVAPQGGTP